MFLLQPRFLLPVAATFGFIGLAFYVASDGSSALDSALVMLFRDSANPSLPLGPAWFREMMRDLTALGSFVGLGIATVIATLTLRLCGHRTLAFGLVLNVLAAVAASTLLKLAFGRERPDIVEHAALTFTASFPSGHAFLAAVVLLSIASFAGIASRRADIARLCLWVAWTLIIAIGVSRYAARTATLRRNCQGVVNPSRMNRHCRRHSSTNIENPPRRSYASLFVR